MKVYSPEGETIAAYRYDSWGDLLEEHEYTNESNPIRYAGEYCDTAYGINLIYLRARYYAPNLRMFITEDPAQDGMNWYAYCGHNPVNFVDPRGTDAIVLTNENGVNGLGHMGTIVQDNNGDWYYFSFGSNYCQFEKIETQFLSDIKTFSDRYYGGGTYTASTYIKGDFSEAKTYFSKFKDNYDGGKKQYNAAFNNCTQVVMDGINRGVLKDGTTVGSVTGGYRGAIPNGTKKKIESTFLNNAWNYSGYHQRLNDLAWDYTEGGKRHDWITRLWILPRIKQLDNISGL